MDEIEKVSPPRRHRLLVFKRRGDIAAAFVAIILLAAFILMNSQHQYQQDLRILPKHHRGNVR